MLDCRCRVASLLRMPANHSKLSGVAARVVCGCSVLPLKSSRDNACRGPAPTAGDDEADIVDEVRVCVAVCADGRGVWDV